MRCREEEEEGGQGAELGGNYRGQISVFVGQTKMSVE